MVIPRKLLRNYKVQFAILLFLLMFSLVHYMKPSISYMPNGAFRQFGVGYKHKTVVPIWAVAIFLAILSYLAIIFLYSQM
jgi:uncharacterized membrane protein